MFEAIAANQRKSAMLIILMAILLGALGYAVGEYLSPGNGPYGLAMAGLVWLVLTLVSWSQGDQIFLSMSGARKVGPEDLPVLWNVVEEMTLAAGLPQMPAVYVIDDPAPNAFATGRKPESASVAVTSGLLKRLNRDELQGVVAHELGHVKNRDIMLMLFAGVLMGAIVLLADVGLRSWFWGGGRSRRSSDSGGGQAQAIMMIVAVVLMILAPILARLVYFAVSRRREYLADASSAAFTRYPEGLASALEKIAAAPPEKLRGVSRATAPMYIVNPLAAASKKRDAASLTATHPPIAERVKILRAMSGASFQDYDRTFAEVTGRRGVLPKSALDDPHAGAGLRVQGSKWREESSRRAAAGAGADIGAGTAPGSVPGVAAAVDTAGAADAGAVAGTAAAATTSRQRAREIDDWLYRQEGYRHITCTCGAKLKVPPGLMLTHIRCPRCHREHALT